MLHSSSKHDMEAGGPHSRTVGQCQKDTMMTSKPRTMKRGLYAIDCVEASSNDVLDIMGSPVLGVRKLPQ